MTEYRLPLVAGRTGWWLDGLDRLADHLRPDVVGYLSHPSACAFQTAEVARRFGRPFVLLPAIHLDVRAHVARAARRLYRAADLILCLSALESRWCESIARVAPSRLLVLGCGWEGPVADRHAPVAGEVRRLLTVSPFVAHKQIDHQLEAIARLRDAGQRLHLAVAGAMREPGVFDALRRQADRLGVAASVTWWPDCDEARLQALHAEADLFLFTSRSESFAIAVIDAIARGVTPVVYPHPVYSRHVYESRCGVVARRSSPAALAAAIVEAGSGSADTDDTARRQWLHRHDWAPVSASLATVLVRLAGDGQAGGSRQWPGYAAAQ